ncbi:hypothetical protein SAMN05216232_2160, partial [Virgibacillus subterraneus]
TGAKVKQGVVDEAVPNDLEIKWLRKA